MNVVKIKQIRQWKREPVFNLTVPHYHNFLVNGGLVVHNCDALRYWCVQHNAPAEVPRGPQLDDWGDEVASYDQQIQNFIHYGM